MGLTEAHSLVWTCLSLAELRAWSWSLGVQEAEALGWSRLEPPLPLLSSHLSHHGAAAWAPGRWHEEQGGQSGQGDLSIVEIPFTGGPWSLHLCG